MDDAHFAHIEGPLEGNQRARLLDLLHRVEAAGNFRFTPDGLVATWVVVVGRGGPGDRPVSISRYRSPLKFNGRSMEAVVHAMERWIAEHAVRGDQA